MNQARVAGKALPGNILSTFLEFMEENHDG